MSSSRSRKLLIPALLGASTLMLTACSNDSGGAEATSTQPETTATTDSTSSESTTDRVSASDVIEAALREVPGDVVGLSMDRDDGDAEVTILKEDGAGAEVTIDLASVEVLQVRDDNLDNEEQSAPTVDIANAMTAALEEVNGSVEDADLGTHFGDLVWEITVVDPEGRDHDVKVNAETGEVIDVERD